MIYCCSITSSQIGSGVSLKCSAQNESVEISNRSKDGNVTTLIFDLKWHKQFNYQELFREYRAVFSKVPLFGCW